MSTTLVSSGSFAAIFRSLPGIHIIAKPDYPHFHIADVTNSFLSAATLSRDDVLGKELAAILPLYADGCAGEVLRVLPVELSRALKNKQPASVPGYFKFNLALEISADIETFWRIIITPQLNDSEVDFLIITIEDITSKVLLEKKQQEAWIELEKSNQQYNSLFYDNPDAAFILDQEGKFAVANHALATLVGCSHDIIMAMTFIPFVHPDDLQRTLTHFKEALKGIPQNYELRVITSKGRELIVNVSNLPLVVDHKITGVYGIARNVTAKREAERLLLSEKEKYKIILENSHDGWMLGTQDGKILEVNPAASRMFGYKEREFKSLGRDAIFDSRNVDFLSKIKSRSETKALNTEVTGIRKNGERFTVHVSSIIFQNENGEERTSTFISDISQRKKSEADLVNSEKLLRQAEAIAQVGSWEIDLLTGEMTWSDEIYRICGITPHSTRASIEKRMLFTHPDDRDAVTAEFRKSVLTGCDYNVQSRIVRPDASLRTVQCEGKLIRNAKGKPVKQVGITRDITEAIAAKDIAKASEERYRTVFHESPLSKWIFDVDTLQFLEVNKAALQQYGYTRDEFLKMTIKEIRPAEDVELLMRCLQDPEKLSGNVKGAFRHKKKNNDLIYVELTRVPVQYDNRRAMMMMAQDVTEKLNFQEALLQSNDRYNYALKASFDAIWDWDLAKDTVYHGEAYSKIFGHHVENTFSTSAVWQTNIHPDDKERVLASIDLALRNKEYTWAAEYRFRKADQTYAYVNDRGILIQDKDGQPYRMVGAMQDVTRQKSEEQEREKLIEELIRSNKDLQQFSYITSHNLKAPLSNLLGIHSIMDTSDIQNPETLLLIDGLSQSTRQLNETINDLHQVLVIKQNVNFNTQELNLVQAWKKTEKLLQGLCTSAGAVIDADFSSAPVVNFNKAYLESIFINLLSNALKYSHPDRKLKIEVSSTENEGSVILSFQDNGLGIDLARHGKKIFGLYQRFHNLPDGRGLGLYMVASQLQALGGKIEVKSKVNIGSCFTVTFPKRTDGNERGETPGA